MINGKIIKLIACTDITNTIGINGKIPWKNKVDMERFQELTFGSTLIMGRKTFESLPKIGLPYRKIHIVSNSLFGYGSNINYKYPFKVYKDILSAVSGADTENVWVAGGAQVYEESMFFSIVDEIDLTIINKMHFDPSVKLSETIYTKFPQIPLKYKLVLENINEKDNSLIHQKYVIRDAWKWR